MKCGLLGQHLSHSYSPQIHSKLGGYSYKLFEVAPENLSDFLTEKDFDGINVTIPYKKAVIPFCHQLSPQAAMLGAVNTIIKAKDGKLIGHNTDHFGFSSMLETSTLSVAGKKVIVLGSGGASVTVQSVLKTLNAEVIVISRSGENNYSNLYLHKDAAVIVNATPVGMYPHCGKTPIDLSQFPALEGVLDLIYNPARTQLLLDAEKRELITRNGLWMLVAQAKESAEWFTGTEISDRIIENIFHNLKEQMENIVLIGMPGCGKSTIGKLLADQCGRRFVDTDAIIEAKAGKTIPEIFQQEGEDKFRELETQVIAETAKASGLVISTGGGCVTRAENYDLLHQNSRIIWLQRDVANLPTAGRPLSQKTSPAELYRVRAPLYQTFADNIILNDGSPTDTAKAILGGNK